ncbi:PAS domain S-box protein [Chitinophaga barathri]|uniref:histidine kinase n=1 Tax=Chitinophaga barathri TaxID=1647451 RepID=A0A3N4M696_9BACT|nr:PAS domain S-box protein [Chitinophaga barathri]RPD38615.1 PAS domain S-box protein [Chitinophaga barathri]
METDTNNQHTDKPAGGIPGAGYLDFIQTLPAAIYSTDASGRISHYNHAATLLWGREPELGKDLWCGSWKIYDTNGEPMALDSCPMAITLREGREVTGVEIIVERPDGSRRNVAPFPRPMFDGEGKMTGAVNMLVDITDIRKAENLLRASEENSRLMVVNLEKNALEQTRELIEKNRELKISEERYHKMIEEVEDYAILLMNKEGIIQNWNKGAEKIKGYREEEIIGKHFSIFYLPEDRQQQLPNKLMAAAETFGKAMQEGWRIRKNGTRFWGSIVITALHNDAGGIIGFSKVTRDLTEKKIAEDKIRKYAEELEFQNKELEQFAYAAAHDMKEPLRKIQFYNNYINEHAGALPEKMKEYLGRSVNAAGRMQQLIDDLLTYSKASSFSQELAPVNLNAIVNTVVLTYHDSIERTGAVIECGLLPVIRAIPFQFNQLFENLISNSLKYFHPDRAPKITIAASLVPGSELKDIRNPEAIYHKITITDNGVGFDTSYTSKIFDLFQRLHDDPGYAGTGIGLAICKKIVQNHQGIIRASSLPSQGAEFAIYLPGTGY